MEVRHLVPRLAHAVADLMIEQVAALIAAVPPIEEEDVAVAAKGTAARRQQGAERQARRPAAQKQRGRFFPVALELAWRHGSVVCHQATRADQGYFVAPAGDQENEFLPGCSHRLPAFEQAAERPDLVRDGSWPGDEQFRQPAPAPPVASERLAGLGAGLQLGAREGRRQAGAKTVHGGEQALQSFHVDAGEFIQPACVGIEQGRTPESLSEQRCAQRGKPTVFEPERQRFRGGNLRQGIKCLGGEVHRGLHEVRAGADGRRSPGRAVSAVVAVRSACPVEAKAEKTPATGQRAKPRCGLY